MQVFKAMGDPYLFMFMGIYYTRTLLELNRPEEAREILQEGLSEVKAADNRWLTALGMEYLARIARSTGDDPETQRLLSESVELHRQVGDPWSLGLALLELSRDQLQRGDFANSEKHALEALGLTVSTGSTPISLESLMILATLCARQGQASEALTLLETILQHPASKQATRDQAECLRSELAASDTGMDWEAARSAAQPSGFAALMQTRFGLRITLPG
jgi:hypothetical protein